jgi:hypothetical protein
MINGSITELKSFTLEMERKMKTWRGILSSLLCGALAALLLAPSAALAQTTVSTFTIQVSGNASQVKTGLSETVVFSGPVVITATVVTDPAASTPTAGTTALPPTVYVSIDGRGVVGKGQKTGTIYNNECEPTLTRLFAATDAIETTFAFFPQKSATPTLSSNTIYLSSKTGVLSLSLTYDPVTMALTGATGAIGTL